MFSKTYQMIKSDEEGQALVEYGLILFLVSVAVVAVLGLLTGQLQVVFQKIITAIGVQREVGGNLTKTLDRIAETVRERERVRGEVSALTAQEKLSGLVISLIAVAGAGWLIGFLMIGKITNVQY